MTVAERLDARYQKFRRMGDVGYVDVEAMGSSKSPAVE
jgi:hypothetical protein